MKEFKKALKGKDIINDFKYFNKLSIEKQNKIIRELKEMNEFSIVKNHIEYSL